MNNTFFAEAFFTFFAFFPAFFFPRKLSVESMREKLSPSPLASLSQKVRGLLVADAWLLVADACLLADA